MSRNLLTDDKQHLKLFDDGVSINKTLPKWKRAEQGIEKTETPKKVVTDLGTSNGTSSSSSYISFNNSTNLFSISVEGNSTPDYENNNGDVDSNIDAGTRWLPLYQTPEGLSFDEIAAAGIKDMTRLIVEKKLKYVMAGYGSFGSTTYNNDYHTIYNFDVDNSTPSEPSKENPKKIKGLFSRLFSKKEEKKEETYEFDAIKFFSLVKATSKESAFTYKDRVSNYLRD